MGAMAVAQQTQQDQTRDAPRPDGNRWSAADLAQFPDDGLRYEIIDGLLLVSPAPRPRHQWVLVKLYKILDAACPARLRVTVAPFDWQIADDTVVQPDILVVPAPPTIDAPITTPELIVEITSPSTARIDRSVKYQRYAEAGVSQYWIVDPGSEDSEPVIDVYDLKNGEYVPQLHADGAQSATITGPVEATVIPKTLTDG